MVAGALERLRPDLRVAHAGVDHDRKPLLVGQREDVIEPPIGDVEALTARVQLESDGAGVEAALRLAERVLGGVEAAERPQPVGVGFDELEHPLVRLAVPAGLLEREDQRARVDLLERAERVLGGGQQAGGIVQPDVDVRVEEPQVVDVAMQHLDPRHEVFLGVHRRPRYPRLTP
jgi:hypothetical protein